MLAMLDFSKMCRVCRDESDCLLDLFVDSCLPHNEPNLAVMLSKCSDCQVDRADGYPQFICADCAGDTRRAFRLREQCRRSLQYFNQLRGIMVELEDVDVYLKLDETGGLGPIQEEVSYAANDTEPCQEDGTMLESLFVELVAPTQACKAPESPKNVKIKGCNSDDNKPLIPACDEEPSESSESLSGDSRSSDVKKTRAVKRLRSQSGSSSDDSWAPPAREKRLRSQSGSSSDDSWTPPAREKAKKRKGKRFQCPHCDASFDHSNILQIHIRVHTGIRPYQCSQCPRSFAQKGNLKTHIRIHTGERPFKCTHCPLTFRQASHLRNHKRIHNDENPFKCAHCSHVFKQKINLERHTMSVHSETKRKSRK